MTEPPPDPHGDGPTPGPFSALLGFRYISVDADEAVVEADPAPGHCNGAGIVHGGFLAVFFDLVLQQLNCDLGVAGKTVTIAMRYRRPTPLLRRLRVTAHRTIDGDRIHSEGELYDGDELLCTAEMSAVAGRVENLPAVSPRRES